MPTRLPRALAQRGAAIVVTGHETTLLSAMADHVTWCADGTTYELGPPSVALPHERLRAMYLGQAATQ